MKNVLLLAVFVSTAAFAKQPESPRPFSETCKRLLLYAPLVAAESGEVVADVKDDEGRTLAQARAKLSSDGMSLLAPSFTHYRGHVGNTELLIRLLAENSQVQEVELTLGDDDLKIFNATSGSKKARVRATAIYNEFAAHGFTNIFFESVGPDEVQVVFAKRGMLWRVLRY